MSLQEAQRIVGSCDEATSSPCKTTRSLRRPYAQIPSAPRNDIFVYLLTSVVLTHAANLHAIVAYSHHISQSHLKN